MTVTTSTPVTSFTSRYGNPAVDCNGAHIRAHSRHVATVVVVSGRIDAADVDGVVSCVKRFVLGDKPVVLDLTAVNHCAAQVVRIFTQVDELCAVLGVDWALVAGDAVERRLRVRNTGILFPVAGSVAEAEHEFDDAISDRRRFLLPLLGKTA